MTSLQRQMLTVLVLDLNYVEAPPMYGWHPMRHQFAWSMATEGMSAEQVRAEVAAIIGADDGHPDQKREVQDDTRGRFNEHVTRATVLAESLAVWGRCTVDAHAPNARKETECP